MAWTDITRRQYEPPKARYASELDDAQRGLLEPMLPAARRLGRPRSVCQREVLNALVYIVMTGCQWRQLSKDSRPSPRFNTNSINGAVAGFDAGKKIKGRKRHIVTDGLRVGLVVHGADIQDRDAAPMVLKSIRKRWPRLRHIFADGLYGGPKLKGCKKLSSFAAFVAGFNLIRFVHTA